MSDKHPTIHDVRRALLRAKRSVNHAALATHRAGRRLEELKDRLRGLPEGEVNKTLATAIGVEVADMANKAWLAYSNTPDHQVRQLARLLGVD